MKILIQNSDSGAGRWCKEGWKNAFVALKHTVDWIDNQHQIEQFNVFKPDLIILSTSNPFDIKAWRKQNQNVKIALNVLAWSDLDIGGLQNDGVQASRGNVEFASDVQPTVVFAQYGLKWRKLLLKKWIDLGYKDSSLMMGADSIVYKDLPNYGKNTYDFVLSAGFWPYKSQTIIPWLLPVIKKYRQNSILIGKGWQFATDKDRTEQEIGGLFKSAKVCPNVHEAHSHFGYDIVERCAKTMYCGGLLVSDFVQEMVDEGFEDGVNCFLCKSPKEYQEKIDEIIQNPGKYDNIRQNGQKFISENHTYIHHVQKLLKDIYQENEECI